MNIDVIDYEKSRKSQKGTLKKPQILFLLTTENIEKSVRRFRR
jgi:hypothetical protein